MTRGRHMRSNMTACLALLVAFCGASAARATTIERMSLEKMSRTAKVIVLARCLGNSTNQVTGEIWTFTNFAVEQVWRGTAPAQIRVRLLGGRAGNLTSNVSGVPRFQAGEEVLLFLEPTSRGDFSVVSWEQGTFPFAAVRRRAVKAPRRIPLRLKRSTRRHAALRPRVFAARLLICCTRAWMRLCAAPKEWQ